MVTSGFFNAQNHDRLYDAEQLSSIFDGIIRDGVLMHYGNYMIVKASQNMTVNVGVGRAWFNHTWTLNNSTLPLTLDPSSVNQNRYDAVVLDINANVLTRRNTIQVVKGVTSVTTPSKPTLIKDDIQKHWQYPLAYIYVKAGTTSIGQADIENTVGTSACPFVTAPLEKMEIDDLIAQWKADWDRWYSNTKVTIEKDWDEFKNDLNQWSITFKNQLSQWKFDTQKDFYTWYDDFRNSAEDWFDRVKGMFNEDNYTSILSKLAALEIWSEKVDDTVIPNIYNTIDNLQWDLEDQIIDISDKCENQYINLKNEMNQNFDSLEVYIQEQIDLRSVFGGKNLGGRNELEDLDSYFDDVRLGDYWLLPTYITENYTSTSEPNVLNNNGTLFIFPWRIVDINYYINCGYNRRRNSSISASGSYDVLNSKHIVVMPDVATMYINMSSLSSIAQSSQANICNSAAQNIYNSYSTSQMYLVPYTLIDMCVSGIMRNNVTNYTFNSNNIVTGYNDNSLSNVENRLPFVLPSMYNYFGNNPYKPMSYDPSLNFTNSPGINQYALFTIKPEYIFNEFLLYNYGHKGSSYRNLFTFDYNINNPPKLFISNHSSINRIIHYPSFKITRASGDAPPATLMTGVNNVSLVNDQYYWIRPAYVITPYGRDVTDTI